LARPKPQVWLIRRKEKAEQRPRKPDRESNLYVRAARVLAKDDTIDVRKLADKAFLSEATAA